MITSFSNKPIFFFRRKILALKFNKNTFRTLKLVPKKTVIKKTLLFRPKNKLLRKLLLSKSNPSLEEKPKTIKLKPKPKPKKK